MKLEQEESVFSILNDPVQSFLRVLARHSAALQDFPFVRQDAIQPQLLHSSQQAHPKPSQRLRSPLHTFRISSALMQSFMSLLFAKTRRLAPINLLRSFSDGMDALSPDTNLLKE